MAQSDEVGDMFYGDDTCEFMIPDTVISTLALLHAFKVTLKMAVDLEKAFDIRHSSSFFYCARLHIR